MYYNLIPVPPYSSNLNEAQPDSHDAKATTKSGLERKQDFKMS